jgi:hypothetical protein
MSQEALSDDVPVVFSVRPWNSRQESWDDYLRALERAYAEFRDRRRQGSEGPPSASNPDPEAEVH